jgi:hypothetical protein
MCLYLSQIIFIKTTPNSTLNYTSNRIRISVGKTTDIEPSEIDNVKVQDVINQYEFTNGTVLKISNLRDKWDDYFVSPLAPALTLPVAVNISLVLLSVPIVIQCSSITA